MAASGIRAGCIASVPTQNKAFATQTGWAADVCLMLKKNYTNI